MTTSNRTIVLAAALFGGLSAAAGVAHAAGGLTAITSKRGGFLTPSDRQAPRALNENVGALVDKLCALAWRNSSVRCPPSAQGPVSSTDEISAGLSNLYLKIILREVRNVVVSGSGVLHDDGYYISSASVSITSTAAPAPYPTLHYLLALPSPEDPFLEWAGGARLFAGIIVNGCLSPPATFDLTLDSTVYTGMGEVVGKTHLVDEVEGHGYYNFSYTIRATDELGNASDLIFSGDADSVCTSQSNL